jgi:hypothetical protein
MIYERRLVIHIMFKQEFGLTGSFCIIIRQECILVFVLDDMYLTTFQIMVMFPAEPTDL